MADLRESASGVCPVCLNDGYIEIWDDILCTISETRDCPRLEAPAHAPFNATGILNGPLEGSRDPRGEVEKP